MDGMNGIVWIAYLEDYGEKHEPARIIGVYRTLKDAREAVEAEPMCPAGFLDWDEVHPQPNVATMRFCVEASPHVGSQLTYVIEPHIIEPVPPMPKRRRRRVRGRDFDMGMWGDTPEEQEEGRRYMEERGDEAYDAEDES